MKKAKNLICYVLSAATAIGGIAIISHFVTKKDANPYDGSSIEFFDDTYDEDTRYDIDGIEYGEEEDVSSYDQLFEEYKQALANIDTDESSYDKCIKAFDELYYNYNDLYSTFSCMGMKDRDSFIRENIIQNLKDNLKTISNQTYNGEPVNVVANNTGDHIYLSEWAESRSVIHELSHTDELYMSMNDNFPLYMMLSEGGACFDEQMCYENCRTNDLITVSNENGDTYAVRSIDKMTTDYIYYSKCYGTLCCLVEWDVIEQAKHDCNANCIEEYLTDTYGIDGKDYMNTVVDICSHAFDGDYYSESVFNSFAKLEQLTNKCFDEKLSSIDDTEELKNFVNIKAYYNKQFATRKLINYVDMYTFDVECNSELDPYNVDDSIYDKCTELGLFNFEGEERGREAFDLIMGDNSNYFSIYSYNEKRSITNKGFVISNDQQTLSVTDKDGVVYQYEMDTGTPKIDYSEIDSSKADGTVKPIYNTSNVKIK